MNDEKKLWPSWRYGPNGAAAIFEHEADVPKGWKDHPKYFAEKTTEPVTQPTTRKRRATTKK